MRQRRHIPSIEVEKVQIGDYIRSRELKKWIKVMEIRKIENTDFLIGEELISNEILAFTSDDSTPAWNHEEMCYGRR